MLTKTISSFTESAEELKAVRKHVGLLVSHDCSMATVGVVVDAFRLANDLEQDHGDSSGYQLSVLSAQGGVVNVSASLAICTEKLDRFSLTDFHALFVACPDDRPAGAYRQFASWLSRQRTVTSTSIGEGLVYKGGDANAAVPIYIFDEKLDGVDAIRATPTEMVLTQLERDLGMEAARKISRALNPPVVDHVRPETAELDVATTRRKVCESARWIRDNYSEPISVAHAAEYAAMSKRNYQRRFKAEFGITPLEYLLRTRFEAVCSMLTDTDLPIDKIARRCGMGDGNRLGRIFKERLGMSPTQYRAHRHMAMSGVTMAQFGLTELRERPPREAMAAMSGVI